jgi:hypothetical protein
MKCQMIIITRSQTLNTEALKKVYFVKAQPLQKKRFYTVEKRKNRISKLIEEFFHHLINCLIEGEPFLSFLSSSFVFLFVWI